MTYDNEYNDSKNVDNALNDFVNSGISAEEATAAIIKLLATLEETRVKLVEIEEIQKSIDTKSGPLGAVLKPEWLEGKNIEDIKNIINAWVKVGEKLDRKKPGLHKENTVFNDVKG